MRLLIPLAVAGVLAATVVAAEARPYKVVARYGPPDADPTTLITIKPGAEIPDDAAGQRLHDLALYFEPKPLGLLAAQAFAPLQVSVAVGAEAVLDPTPLDLGTVQDGGFRAIHEWRRSAGAADSVSHVKVTVRATLSPKFLCAVEAYVRDQDGKATAWPQGTGGDKARKEHDKLYKNGKSSSPILVLTDDGDELYYSFCDNHAPSWNAIRTHLETKLTDEEKDALEKTQRTKLLAKLTPTIAAFFASWAKFDEEDPSTIIESFEFDVFRTAEIFNAYEYRTDEAAALTSLVDIDSQLSFEARHGSTYCPAAQDKPFRYELQEVGNEQSRTAIKPRFLESCGFVLPVDLGAYKTRGKLLVRALYDTDGAQPLVLYEFEFKVRELGFVWSLPVLTEIRAAVNGWSKDQLRAQSSIPLSYAIGLGNAGNGVAVTAPWKITYSSRTNPNLSEMVAFYPHISLIVSKSDSGSTPVTFAAGVGVAFIGGLHFSYGLGFSGSHEGDHYILIGLDVSELADLRPTF